MLFLSFILSFHMQTILILLSYFIASHKYLIALNLSVGTSVMAQWVQRGLPLTLTTSLILGPRRWKEKTGSRKLSSDFQIFTVSCAHVHIQQITENESNKTTYCWI